VPDAPPAQASIDWRPLDALQLADRLRERLVELHLSEHYVPDDGLRRLLRSIWSGPGAEGGLGGELWVEGAFPFLTSDSTLDDLVRSDEVSGELVDQLARVGAFPRDLPLYSHQLAAIRAARGVAPDGGRPSVVVSSPTGSGKTEAFLLPLLSRLFGRPRVALLHFLLRNAAVGGVPRACRGDFPYLFLCRFARRFFLRLGAAAALTFLACALMAAFTFFSASR